MTKAAKIRCTGRVQGVFFRATTKSEADDLNLRGWVRNEPNGDVLIMAEGEESAINALAGWCRSGPDLARVADVSITWIDPGNDGLSNDFEIRH